MVKLNTYGIALGFACVESATFTLGLPVCFKWCRTTLLLNHSLFNSDTDESSSSQISLIILVLLCTLNVSFLSLLFASFFAIDDNFFALVMMFLFVIGSETREAFSSEEYATGLLVNCFLRRDFKFGLLTFVITSKQNRSSFDLSAMELTGKLKVSLTSLALQTWFKI